MIRKKKLVGIIIVDLALLLSPLFTFIDTDLFTYINIFAIGLTMVTMMVMLFSDSESDTLKKMVKDHQTERPSWWNIYDFGSDLLLIIVWSYFGFYTLPFLLVVIKGLTLHKTPEYFELKDN